MSDEHHYRDPDRWARLGFSIIGPLLAAPPAPGELPAALTELPEKSWRHPITAAPIHFGVSTLESNAGIDLKRTLNDDLRRAEQHIVDRPYEVKWKDNDDGRAVWTSGRLDYPGARRITLALEHISIETVPPGSQADFIVVGGTGAIRYEA